jgi:hypothetical protein
VATRRYLGKALIGIGVSAGLLAYLLSTVDLVQVGAHLAKTNWGYLTLSVCLALFAVWVRAWRWRYLFPPGAHPSHLFSAVMIGYMANNVLPLRAGELVRGYVVAKRGRQGFWTAIATIAVERLLDALAVVIILAGLLLAISVPSELKWGALAFLTLDLAAMGVLATVALAPAQCQRVVTRLFARWPALRAKLLRILETFLLGLQGIRTGSHLLPILAGSVALWVVYALATWTALAAAHLALSLTAAWTVLAFIGLGISLPSAPGFIGVFQAATVLALALFGVPRSEALSFSFLFHASQFVPITLIGWVLLITEQISLSQATRPGDRS